MNVKELVNLYIDEQAEIIKVFPVEAVSRACERIIAVYEDEGVIYICGNGGNAAFADNLMVDLYFHPFVSDDKGNSLFDSVKKTKVVNLSISPAMITGSMNDFGPDYIFSQPLEGRLGPKDVVVGFSGSGNSANIIKAFETAKKYHSSTIGITRGAGGKMKDLADICIVIPGTSRFPGQVGKNDNNFHFEDYLSSISHMMTGILQKYVREKYGR